ncbi:glycoside hydrolase [Mucilaginibacter daejeonensis]|uniref:glycosyl hydrolase n=1 Tax=Mucilaginibacter daejeonensis TaxID=398049 RepID=UPI001D170FEE|nr:glycosyl hydrolase [Mucilaginibacter daejeonensis]UEG54006.1 glycoside hydrolase [Mucilaginibacter daejeonensis]
MHFKRSIYIMALCATATSAMAQSTKSTVWPVIKTEARPWTRWWWMGNAVDKPNIGNLLKEYKHAGLGGVEVTPIYGAIGYESRYIDFLSPKWMDMLTYTHTAAAQLGMGVDMNTGTGWPFGGPQIKPADAASRLIVQTYKLAPGQTLKEAVRVNDPKQRDVAVLQAVVAYDDKGNATDLTAKVDASGNLNMPAVSVNTEIYAAFAGKTLQKVKRAAPGGDGYTLDHLSKTATDVYLARFTNAFKNSKGAHVRAFFNDSYEVFGADWSPDLFASFIKDHGYDLRLHLRELMGTDKSETVGRIKSDYRETMSNMLLHNFTQNWTNWAHSLKSITKNQSHGSPGNLLDLYGTVDIPECETFGSSKFTIPGLRRDSADVRNVDPDPIMLKFASSAGHVNSKPLVSSETFTWLTEHFKTAFSQCKPEVEQLFLAGVNHVFYHGTTYSPADVKFPGWLFYASMNMVPSNSLWSHATGLNGYIARVQSVLQAGKADNEVLMYWPIYDAWNEPKGMDIPFRVHDIDEWLHPTKFYKDANELQDKGYSIDFVSDMALSKSTGSKGGIKTSAKANYKVLVVPQCKMMPLPTLQQIIRLASEGATVIFQSLPQDVPGFADLENRRKKLRDMLSAMNFVKGGDGLQQTLIGKGKIILANDLDNAMAKIGVNGEQLINTGLKFIRRDVDGSKYYYLVNHTSKAIDTRIPLNGKYASATIMDPQSGSYGAAPVSVSGNRSNVRVQLQSGEALIVLASIQPRSASPKWKYLEKADAQTELKGPWELRFTTGGPALPSVKKLEKLTSWTALGDTTAVNFSGTGVYTTSFEVAKKATGEYVLDLGKVDESARVWVNGQEVGILWSIPFKARVGKYLKAGKNTIKIEVNNLMANRMRYMDQHKIEWRKYHEINFVNINYKPFDASNWEPMPSGLLGPVKLVHCQ